MANLLPKFDTAVFETQRIFTFTCTVLCCNAARYHGKPSPGKQSDSVNLGYGLHSLIHTTISLKTEFLGLLYCD